jgi:hypothetical protein
MSQIVGPAVARAELDRLESAIVDPERGRGADAGRDAVRDERVEPADGSEPPD